MARREAAGSQIYFCFFTTYHLLMICVFGGGVRSDRCVHEADRAHLRLCALVCAHVRVCAQLALFCWRLLVAGLRIIPSLLDKNTGRGFLFSCNCCCWNKHGCARDVEHPSTAPPVDGCAEPERRRQVVVAQLQKLTVV